MKCKDILIIISLICLAPLICEGKKRTRRGKPREAPYKKINNVEFDIVYDIEVPGKASKIKLWALLPKTMPRRQKILRIKYSPEPIRILNKDGCNYAEFIFEEPPKQFQIQINVKAKLFRYDLSTARKKPKQREPNNFDPNDFLKPEKSIEKDHPLIQSIAKSIRGKTETEVVKNIQDYIINNVDYSYNKEDKGALYAVNNKTGDCSEYSDLFVTLCRAKNLPARSISGFTSESTLTPKHAWAEVYLRKHGWVPFDPTWADVSNTGAKQFHYLKSVYVYMINMPKEPDKFKGTYYWYWYWGDKPNINHSVKFKKSSDHAKKPRQRVRR